MILHTTVVLFAVLEHLVEPIVDESELLSSASSPRHSETAQRAL
jgi:hypothetical protein